MGESGWREFFAHDVVRGGVCGFLATLPMTLFMLLVHRVLPKSQRYAVPPEEITDWMLERTGLRKRMSKTELLGTALVAHFSFGSSAGLIYRSLAGRRSDSVTAGVGFGLVVYTINYAGWLPALGVLDTPLKMPKGRVLMMGLAHVVYGAALSLTSKGLRSHEDVCLRSDAAHPNQ